MAAPAPTTATPAAPASTAPPAIKVFVGNLAFKTRDGELQTAFAQVGAVVRAKVIRDPNRRSLGYGFVEMQNLEDAKKAVEAMNKKEIDGRQINVELAKPRDENAPRKAPSPGSAPRGGRGGARGGLRGGRGGARGGRRLSGNQRTSTGVPQEDRKPSKTTLFVSNLPFSMDEAALTKLFGDKGFKPSKATVVKRQNGRSKGFGFVEFDSEENQNKALNAVNGQTLEGRQLTVRIALTELSGDNTQQQQQQPQQGGQSAPAQQQTQAAPAQQQQQQKPATAPAQQQGSGKQEATPAQPAGQTPKQEAKKEATPAAAPAKTESPAAKKGGKK